MFQVMSSPFHIARRTRAHPHHPLANQVRLASQKQQSRSRGWPRLSERDRERMETARAVAREIVGERARAGASSAEASVSEAGEAETPALVAPTAVPSAALPPRGRVLVLDDLTTSVDARTLVHLGAKLAERGFDVVGRGDDQDEAAAAIELLAGARHALGLGRAEEEETQANLQSFLDEQPELDALILVSRAQDESEHLYRVFVRGKR
jgi:hypothetical protein